MPSAKFALTLLVVLCLAACDDDDPVMEEFEATLAAGEEPHDRFAAALTAGSEPHRQFRTSTLDASGEPHVQFRGTLTGSQEVGPVTTDATGRVTFTLNGDQLTYRLDVEAIDSAVAAHIHLGAPGVNGPVLVGLFAGPPTGIGFSGTLASGTVTVADSVVEAMRGGRAYVNVHTRAHPPGEIRALVEEVSTDATGAATFTLNGNELTYRLTVEGIDSAVAAHIHAGQPGGAGPVLVGLFSGPPTGAGFSGTLAQGTVTVADSVVAAMAAGNSYVNVHTRANPPGAIRAQVSEVVSDGAGAVTFNLVGNQLTYSLSVQGVDSAVAAHIHAGSPGVAGPVLVGLFSGPATAADFSGVLAEGTVTVADSVATALRAGNTYVNVHTAANPPGAIRGQVAEVTSTATGTATFSVEGRVMTFQLSVAGVDSATAAHIHAGQPGEAGPVLVGLFSGPTTGRAFTGVLSEGMLTVADSVLQAMRAGNTYVNVHTFANPSGAIRGQIRVP